MFRLAHLGVINTLALRRLLPMIDLDKGTEILALRHQIMVLERQLHGDRVRFTPADRAWLAALLHPLPRTVLSHLRCWCARRTFHDLLDPGVSGKSDQGDRGRGPPSWSHSAGGHRCRR
nr:hypothetical protein [Micromonospora tarapacensis]